MSSVVSIDFETLYDSAGGYGIRELGVAAYVRHARFDPYLVSVSDGSDTWSGPPSSFNWDSLRGKILVAHNMAFDGLVLAEMMRRGLAPTFEFSGHCTANLSVYLCQRRSLAKAAEFLLGVTPDKSVRKKADGQTWADMVKADGGKEMLAYARQDALLCWQLWDKFSHLWPESERQLSALTIKQCQRGCQIDVPALKKQLYAAQAALIDAEASLPWVKAGRPPTSPKAIAELCRAENIPCPPIKSHENGEEEFAAWESAYRPKYPWVKAVADYRVLKKYIGQLETIKTRISDEGIFNYDLLYFGAGTGRWTGSGGYNVQNMRKNPLEADGNSLDIRALFIPRLGRKMIISDLAQIEPRILAYLAEDAEMLSLMAAGHSPYQAHAISTMGWTGGDLKTENKTLYALSKGRTIGLGYGCGWERFIDMAYAIAGLDLTADDPEFVAALNEDGTPRLDEDGKPVLLSGRGQTSKRIVKEYRESNPKIMALWKKLEDAFRASVGGNFEMTLPSGRVLRYPEVRRERKPFIDPEFPKKIQHKWATTALVYDQKMNRVVRKSIWAGHLVENACQATARDVFASHLLALEATGRINVLFHSHDEAVCEVDEGVCVKEVEDIMSVSPKWLTGCPVRAEATEVKCYQK